MSDVLKKSTYLKNINTPSDLRKLNVNQLRQVCTEVREYLIDEVSKTGGHLGAGLGSVEIIVALHYVFETPIDKLLFDVGHQAYPHKILTGRKELLHTIRQFKGLSGFLRREESEYDVFGAGHASTAISAALGIATARDFKNDNFKVVAIVGDGSLTGGLSYEAMNNAGLLKKNMIVVLNDNKMVSLSSVKPNHWSLHNYFSEVFTHPTYNKFKANVWELTGKLDSFGDRLRAITHNVEKGIKAIVTPGMLFEAFGFRYFGPFNGHNVVKLVETLQNIKDLNGPILLHCISEKGKGYEPAEKEITRLHGVTPFDKITGISPKPSNPTKTFTTIFGESMVELCNQNEKVVAITAAMSDGTGLTILQKKLPEKVFDVGIAEAHAVTFAAGIAIEEYIPVVAIYSTFLQRAYDNIIHDVALQDLHVIFILDRGGLVGADGPTHHGAFDLSYLRCIPGMTIMAPKDESELRDMLYTAINFVKGPVAIRYPRGNAFGVEINPNFKKVELHKSETLKYGTDLAILSIGTITQEVIKAANILEKNNISAEIINMRFVKPIDSERLKQISQKFKFIVTVEENSIYGGFGSAVIEELSKLNLNNSHVLMIGLEDSFVEHGSPKELYELTGLDAEAISKRVINFIKIQKANSSIEEVELNK
ncbi:MAG: 1-deoxy-D-xylulose-5-phosphate synthase [Bacteroidetes bacterium]|nr:1-deoxy-D-xylulose-5-phosphate synthase [Bacteroidota bacterium]